MGLGTFFSSRGRNRDRIIHPHSFTGSQITRRIEDTLRGVISKTIVFHRVTDLPVDIRLNPREPHARCRIALSPTSTALFSHALNSMPPHCPSLPRKGADHVPDREQTGSHSPSGFEGLCYTSGHLAGMVLIQPRFSLSTAGARDSLLHVCAPHRTAPAPRL